MVSKVLEEFQAIPGLKLECPSCSKKFPFDAAIIFDSREGMPDEALSIFAYMKAHITDQKMFITEKETEIVRRRKELDEELRDAPPITRTKTAGINFGQMVENIVPAFKSFPYKPKDCRQLFDPIDYLIFHGLSDGKVESITFADVKTGTSRLNAHQKAIKKSVEDGRVSFSVMGGTK
jgi:predicted Holliday junction resolvase-like endonuclease